MKRDATEGGLAVRGKSSAGYKEPHCLYPGDLYPYTRRPLFIIIDSDNSFVFQHIPRYEFVWLSSAYRSLILFLLLFRYFGQPLVILMSPQDVPANFQGMSKYNSKRASNRVANDQIFNGLLFCFLVDIQHHGSLFTLFLHSPMTALCYICNVGDVPIHHWERCQNYVDRFVTEASRLVTRCRMDEIEQGIGYIGIGFRIKTGSWGI